MSDISTTSTQFPETLGHFGRIPVSKKYYKLYQIVCFTCTVWPRYQKKWSNSIQYHVTYGHSSQPPSAKGRSCSCSSSCWLMISWILCSCRWFLLVKSSFTFGVQCLNLPPRTTQPAPKPGPWDDTLCTFVFSLPGEVCFFVKVSCYCARDKVYYNWTILKSWSKHCMKLYRIEIWSKKQPNLKKKKIELAGYFLSTPQWQ